VSCRTEKLYILLCFIDVFFRAAVRQGFEKLPIDPRS